ncbi:MAG: 5-dehydro-2-deoxygluconokinase [Gammaproteobacteria bacterium]|nr:5-dehydro-2-deoxygluconokinase [Gammaproteobacteria bacterium]
MTQLDLISIGRVSVDLYGQQVGSRLEDVATFAKGVGGCPANVAIGAARLGLRSALISRVGDEPMGRFVQEQLRREGVDTRGLRTDPQRLTSLVLLSVRDERSFPLIFYRENCADSALCTDDIDEALIGSARAVLVTGTHFSLPGGARAQHKAIEAALAHSRQVILDIDYRPSLWGIGGHDAGESRYARSAQVTQALAAVLPRCHLVVGTEEELHIAAGVEDTLAALRQIRSVTDAIIVCKRGPRGCVVLAGEVPRSLEAALVVPGLDIEIYNVLGAGDAFLAGFLKGFLAGAAHEESARLANACGALAVSRLLCSSEFPTWRELEHFLARGSRHRALRRDEELNHLHRVTTRRPRPAVLRALAIDVPASQPATGTPGSDSPERFRELMLEAVTDAAAGREGFGALLRSPDNTLREALPGSLWVARSVHRAGSRPLELADGGSLGVELTEWPIDLTVHCRCEHRPDDPPAVREADERSLARLAAVCRAQGREWLLEIGAGTATPDPETLARYLSRLYALDIRPDWWGLEPQSNTAAWRLCVRAITENDGDCRGVLVVLEDAARAGEALADAAGTALVRGFIAGGSIVADAAAAWRAGQLADVAVVAGMAERLAALVEVWAMARDPRLNEPQRSGN